MCHKKIKTFIRHLQSFERKIEEAKAKDLNSEHKNGYESILKTAVSDIEKLNNSVNITEKEFAEIKNSMKNNKGFLSQLDKDLCNKV